MRDDLIAHIEDGQLQQQARDYARKVSGKAIKDGFTPNALHCYTTATGTPLYWKIRAKHANGDKWIRSISAIGDNWQMKEPDFKTVYADGNGKKPLYRLHELVASNHDAHVWLFEGEQKADLACELGFIATTCGGASNIDTVYLEPLAGRAVTIWADNDEAGIKARDELITALQAIDCTVSYVDVDALNLPPKGDIVDFVELREQDGIDSTQADIERLAVVHCEAVAVDDEAITTDRKSVPKGHLCEPMAYGGNGARFEILPNGIFYISKDQHDNERSIFISTPILVVAKTRDSNSNAWGRLLQWHDDEGVLHQWAMPMQLLQGDGGDVRRELADQGAVISSEKKRRDLLTLYLGCYPVERFALCVDRLGWHGARYVLPKSTHGAEDDNLTVFQNSNALPAQFNAAGTLEDWQQHVSQAAEPHSHFVFALSCGFAGQLLEPLKEQGGGFHFRGDSSTGKSIALDLAGSIWGEPQKIVYKWKATGNALESIAALHNDSFLGLDELGLADARDVGKTIYMLADGVGKARMQRAGGNRPTAEWRVIFLSSGEVSLESVVSQSGTKAKAMAGQQVRFADMSADAEHGLGMFDCLNLDENPSKQADMMKHAAQQYNGAAGLAWVEYITQDKHQLKQDAKQLINQFINQYAPNKTGQVMRGAGRFALVAAAGELATAAGITGWQQWRAFEAVGRCFKAWLAGFGDSGNHEERSILADVKAFFEAHGSSRFENLQGDPDRPQQAHNRAGYFKYANNQKIFLVLPEQFRRQICQGHDPKRVAKTLKAAGWLVCNAQENMKSERLPDHPKPQRVYVFNGAMWDWVSEQNPDSQNTTRNTRNTRNNLQPQGFELLRNEKTEHVTHVTNHVTSQHVTNNDLSVTSVTYSQNGTRNTAKPLCTKAVTSVTSVTDEKQRIQDAAATQDTKGVI